MARNCYLLRVGDKEYKLRLTLKGQKNLKKLDPDAPMMALVMGAVDDPEAMEALLTEALSWEGNSNKTHSGAELYDEMVDAGFSGSEEFLEVVLNIAKNAGLLTEDERCKVERVTTKMIRKSMDELCAEDEEVDEGPEDPTKGFRTL